VNVPDISVALLVFLQAQFNAALKISNMNLLKAVLECLKACAASSSAENPFDKRVTVAILPLCADKITEKKIQVCNIPLVRWMMRLQRRNLALWRA
jgi:hypothetical protein